jgi:hypothetical protein
MALAIFGVAVAMLACMQGWNAAAHRKDESTARVMSILFYVFTAVLIGSLAKMMFFEARRKQRERSRIKR